VSARPCRPLSAAARRPRDRQGSCRRPTRRAGDHIRYPAPVGCLFLATFLI
jgi:hypothetical protein